MAQQRESCSFSIAEVQRAPYSYTSARLITFPALIMCMHAAVPGAVPPGCPADHAGAKAPDTGTWYCYGGWAAWAYEWPCVAMVWSC